jgi:competence protein ComEA
VGERAKGERARVARRVRGLLDAHHPGGAASRHVDERWLPGVDFDAGVPSRPAGDGGDVPDEVARSGHSVVSSPSAVPTPWLQRLRFDPGLRGAAGLGCAALIAALVAGWWVLAGRAHSVPISVSPPVSPPAASRPAVSAPSAPSSAAGSADSVVVVDVVGKVRRPGVYRLGVGSRVDDALRAAGGALHAVDLSSLNRARKLTDGEQIAVGVLGATAAGGPSMPAGPAGSAGSTPGSAPVDLNTASLEQLDGLPGVGPVLAQRIVDWRTAHGRFASVDQLREVSGIGPSKFDDIRGLVTV